jgi:hypothetical protein
MFWMPVLISGIESFDPLANVEASMTVPPSWRMIRSMPSNSRYITTVEPSDCVTRYGLVESPASSAPSSACRTDVMRDICSIASWSPNERPPAIIRPGDAPDLADALDLLALAQVAGRAVVRQLAVGVERRRRRAEARALVYSCVRPLALSRGHRLRSGVPLMSTFVTIDSRDCRSSARSDESIDLCTSGSSNAAGSMNSAMSVLLLPGAGSIRWSGVRGATGPAGERRGRPSESDVGDVRLDAVDALVEERQRLRGVALFGDLRDGARRGPRRPRVGLGDGPGLDLGAGGRAGAGAGDGLAAGGCSSSRSMTFLRTSLTPSKPLATLASSAAIDSWPASWEAATASRRR